ncbi:M16 family metallopeptidase [Undibacterium fentianense]|uniref:Insulinase family protein n=1 Tax=Undibacterium fentianense TaxID=2828728 RepID=A0A941E5G0_9BURK|nr:M16 family metallopeptidase [Undibacterium fentianense]MBR7800053.1 insulinase family protein [Undibacterium fentianense]
MRQLIKSFLLVHGLALLLCVEASARVDFPLHERIPYSPSLAKGQLPNGLTYYIQKNGKPEQKLELRLVVKAGSILEDADQLGLAHFVEHMAFNGSAHFKKNELVSFLESIGVKFGADLNAYTGFDETVYILPIPTDRPENVEKGMMVLADWAYGLRFDPTEIDRERGVVLEEARLGKGAADRLQKIILPKVLHGSRYAERLPIGKEENLKSFRHAALKRFYQDWYRPDLMAIVVVGDLEVPVIQALLEKYFSTMKNPQKPRKRLRASVPLENQESVVIATDKEANLASVSISQGRMHQVNDGRFASYRQRRIQSFFNAMLNQRLHELTQVQEPPFLAASSGISSLVAEYNEFNSSVVIGKAGVQAAVQALVAENQRLAQYGFSQVELERVKLSTLRYMENAFNERDKSQSAEFAAEFVRNFLTGEAIPGIEAEYIFHREFVRGISLEEVNRFAQSVLLARSPKLIVYQGGTQQGQRTPSKSELASWIRQAEQSKLGVYREQTVTRALIDTKPTIGSILQESRNAVLGTIEWTLSNGVRVVLKPTDFKNKQILLSASRPGGLGMIDASDYSQAMYATSVVGAMGIKDITPIELGKYLAGKSSSMSTNFSDVAEGISGSSTPEDFETTLQILYLLMTSPRRDPDLFRSYVTKQQDVLRNQMATPSAIFQKAYLQTSYQDHPRQPKLATPEDLQALDMDRLIAIYQSRFSSADKLTFFIVGSFEPEKIKTVLLTYLANLPVHPIESGLPDHGLRLVKGIVHKEVYAGKEQRSLVTLQLHGERPVGASDELRFSALTEILQLRLTAKMREELGAVYSPRVTAQIKKIPFGSYSIVLVLPSGPEHVEKLLQTSRALLEEMKRHAVTEEELHKVKENWLKNRKEEVKTNEFWIGVLSDANFLQEDAAKVFDYENQIQQLKPEDIQQAARIYFDLSNQIQIVMYPEKTVLPTSISIPTPIPKGR